MTLTTIGTDDLSTAVRHQIMPEFIDFVYNSNPLLYRLYNAKRIVRGGRHVEYPAVTSDFSNGGFYEGYEELDVSPNDTTKSLAFGWRYAYTPLTVDGPTLVEADSDVAIAHHVNLKAEQARMRMGEILGTAIMNDGSVGKSLIGLEGAVDDGSVLATYGNLTRASNTYLNSTVDSSTSALTLAALQTLFGNCTKGGQTPTLILSRQEQYNRFIALVQSNQRIGIPVGGTDDIIASAGFTNALYNNVPWIVDSHTFDGPNSSNSAIVMLNERWIELVVSPRGDMVMRDFVEALNQDAMTALILFAGYLAVRHPGLQGKMTNVSS